MSGYVGTCRGVLRCWLAGVGEVRMEWVVKCLSVYGCVTVCWDVSERIEVLGSEGCG